MKNRRDTGLIGRARRVLVIGVPAVGLAVAMVGVVPAQQTLAQDSSGGSINIGGSIAATVAAAVSTSPPVAAVAPPLAVSRPSRIISQFGDDESMAISDASGGRHNVSEKSESHNGH